VRVGPGHSSQVDRRVLHAADAARNRRAWCSTCTRSRRARPAVQFHHRVVGLVILSIAFFPSGWQASYPDRKSFNEEAYGAYSRPKAKKPGALMSLDVLAGKAKDMWGGVEPWAIVVQHPGDAEAYVSVLSPSIAASSAVRP